MTVRPLAAAPAPPPAQAPARPSRPLDRFEPESPTQRAMGTIGAGVGALLGRLAVPTVATVIGAQVGASMLGSFGGVIGGVLGLAAGGFVEFRNRQYQGVIPVGRFFGGMLGGIAGASLGATFDRLGLNLTSERMRKETEGFSLAKLSGRLLDVGYTSHETLSAEHIQDFKSKLKPGDIVITNHDKWLDLEIPEVLLGIGGAWTHTAVYVGNGDVVEALWGTGVGKRPVDELLAENHHARILRPAYKTDQDAQAAADEALKHVGAGYDAKFDLQSDESFGCVELVYKAVHRAAPYVDMQPHKLFGKEFLSHKVFNRSPDMTVVEDSGSSFLYNYLSKFS